MLTLSVFINFALYYVQVLILAIESKYLNHNGCRSTDLTGWNFTQDKNVICCDFSYVRIAVL